MKLTVAAENPLDRLILALGVAPVTLMDTHMSPLVLSGDNGGRDQIRGVA